MTSDRTASESGGLPVAPSMNLALASLETPRSEGAVSRRLLTIVGLAILIGIGSGIIAKLLMALIALITNLVFFGRASTALIPPTLEVVGYGVLIIPALGAVIVGLMARWGSPAIRGHGIPEVMEKVLYGESRIPARLMFLKPLSAAVAIGTGGPFGAEGPVIATGGALGSVVGQMLRVTADERKALLAAGAASGMTAVFGTPMAAVLLAIELLLFEYRARSIIPVALSAAAAMAMRKILVGEGPVFPMPVVAEPGWAALAAYVVLGALIGVAAVLITRATYAIEDGFERLPVHWMWWPAIGALVVGAVGYLDPRVLGVGYQHITLLLSGTLLGWSLLTLVVLKLIAWSVYLGSGTSGGTLAPLFIIGGGLGALLGSVAANTFPSLGISVPVAALVGMAAMFAGASHALIASVVFAFEATLQPFGVLPLLAGCSAAYLVSLLSMETSIMTEKLARRGTLVRTEYAMDFLSQVLVRDFMTAAVVTLPADQGIRETRAWLEAGGEGASHQGFPVVDVDGRLLGLVSHRDLLAADLDSGITVRELIGRPAVVVHDTNTLREAADHMVRTGVGRVPVVDPGSGSMVGIISRSDLLAAHQKRLRAAQHRSRPRYKARGGRNTRA